jgi:putative redox protein
MKKFKYSNEEITVIWQPEVCKHSGVCCRELPEVFNLKYKPGVASDTTPSERIIEQIGRCPSGALSFFYNNDIDDKDM